MLLLTYPYEDGVQQEQKPPGWVEPSCERTQAALSQNLLRMIAEPDH
jgi:hypothetical protein